MEQLLTVPIIVLAVISGILWLIIGVFAIWQLYMAVAGKRKIKQSVQREHKSHMFAVIICARNEEAVIGNLIESLQNQEYPKDRYDIIVVADNCTDRTAAIAAECGAYVYERFDEERVGKGFALQWICRKLLHESPKTYEAFTVFDADNIVDPAYLYHMNEALCRGADATQGYREVKNPFDSVVSGCYTIYWYMLSRFYHQARTNRGLPCSIGGTGFAFKRRVIEKTGWYTVTLTEDSEFASRKILEGFSISFVREAVTYDEQPTTWKTSFTQRFRWMYGISQESRVLLKPAYKAWRAGNKNAFDVLMFLSAVPAIAVVLVAVACSLAAAILAAMKLWEDWYSIIGITALLLAGTLYLVVFLIAYFAVKGEKGKIGRFWPAVFTYPIFLAPMALFVFVSYFKRDLTWKPIAHTGETKKPSSPSE